MKTTKWFLALLLATLALLFAGCGTSDDISEGGGGGNGTDDDGNEVTAVGGTPDKATLVTVGNSSSHIIKTDGKHWFKFVGTGETVIFETTGDIVDTYIAIWDNQDYAKREILSDKADDNSGEGYNALATFNTTSGTTYFIRITAQNNSSGTYGFAVKSPTANGRLSAISVTDGYSSSNTITSTGEHWFKFIGTGETVIFETESNVVTTDIDIYIGENTSSTFAEKGKISVTTISGTTYYIKIKGNSGTYIFKASNGSGDGSSPSYAIPVAVGYSSSHTIASTGKQWFSFIGTGETVIFETTGGAVDTYIAIWDNHNYAKREILSDKADDNSGEGYNALATFNTTLGTTYFVQVTAKNNSSGTYGFIVKSPTVNGRLSAISVTDGYSSSNTITSTGEHWFKFVGTGETVIFETESNVVTANIGIYIGDNTSTTFAEQNRISIITISGTTYYIKVTGNSGTYIFKVNNGFGDGSSPSYAIPVAVGYSSSHTIVSTGKQWFSFIGTGSTMTFETTGNAVDTYIAIWNNHNYANREILSDKADDNSGEGQNAKVSINTTSGTTYFIKIEARNNSSGTYTLVVQ